ncbi:hypothetical protein RCH11_001450 [Glaciihabitans sp. GrIS 2.15]|nr:hypothetical protein [Glaciihabitans sp. GrIS 2.15]
MTFWTRDPQITGAAEFDRTLPVTVIGIDCLVTPSGKLDQLCGLPDTGSCPGSAFPAITELAHDTPSWGEITRLIHSTPLPCGKSHETVKRADLAGHAGYGYGYGYCAFHSRYFWGFRLYLSCTPERIPVVWGLANPKIGEREAADEGSAGKEEKPRLGKLGRPTIPGVYSQSRRTRPRPRPRHRNMARLAHRSTQQTIPHLVQTSLSPTMSADSLRHPGKKRVSRIPAASVCTSTAPGTRDVGSGRPRGPPGPRTPA